MLRREFLSRSSLLPLFPMFGDSRERHDAVRSSWENADRIVIPWGMWGPLELKRFTYRNDPLLGERNYLFGMVSPAAVRAWKRKGKDTAPSEKRVLVVEKRGFSDIPDPMVGRLKEIGNPLFSDQGCYLIRVERQGVLFLAVTLSNYFLHQVLDRDQRFEFMINLDRLQKCPADMLTQYERSIQDLF